MCYQFSVVWVSLFQRGDEKGQSMDLHIHRSVGQSVISSV